jgi:hypothetical protein
VARWACGAKLGRSPSDAGPVCHAVGAHLERGVRPRLAHVTTGPVASTCCTTVVRRGCRSCLHPSSRLDSWQESTLLQSMTTSGSSVFGHRTCKLTWLWAEALPLVPSLREMVGLLSGHHRRRHSHFGVSFLRCSVDQFWDPCVARKLGTDPVETLRCL